MSHRLYKDDLKAFFTPLATFCVVNGGIRGSFIQLVQKVQKVQLFYAHLSPQTKEEEDFFEKLMLVIIKGTDDT